MFRNIKCFFHSTADSFWTVSLSHYGTAAIFVSVSTVWFNLRITSGTLCWMGAKQHH